MDRKTSFKSSIIGLTLAISCLCVSIVVLWGLPIGQRLRPVLLQESEPILPKISYVVVTPSLQFEYLWTKSPFWNNYGNHQGGIHLAATDKYAFLLGSIESNEVGELTMTKLNMFTGEVEWVRLDSSSLNKGAATTVSVNSDRIYVGFDGTQKISGDTTWGAGKVVAYDIGTSDIVWSKTIPGARGIETLVITDSSVSVDGAFSSSNYLLDAGTGDVIDIIEKPNLIWFTNNGISYERQKSFSFQARDRETSEIIWQNEEDYYPSQPPILTDRVIVARSGNTGFLGIAFAIDNATGNLIWEYKDVLSNISVDGSTAFFLTKNMELVAIDIETGEVLGQTAFTSNLTRERTSDIHHFITASNDIVIVYLGDSQQLFAFHFLPDE